MDERIDLTQNRDFRHEREPEFKDAHFFNFKKKKSDMVTSLTTITSIRNFIDDTLEILSNNQRIIIRDSKLVIEKAYNISDNDSRIITCERCGRKIISINRMLCICDKCNDILEMELNRQLELSSNRRLFDSIIELNPAISIVHSDDEFNRN